MDQDDELTEALRQRQHAADWRARGDGVGWEATTEDGTKMGAVRRAGTLFEGRVYRHPTGPTPGPDPELDHGPQMFRDAVEAVDYVEAAMGWIRPQG